MFLGLDIGSSALKATVIDQDGAVVAETAQPLTTRAPQTGWAEQDPQDWWAAVTAAVSRLPRSGLIAIGVTGQMHGPVLLDRAREVLAPVMIWTDQRAKAEAAMLDGTLAGAQPSAKFPAAKLLWLARQRPDQHARIAHVLMPKDWLGLRLHGGLVSDPSDAAGTLWFDQERRAWSVSLCQASATKLDWLPEVRAANVVAGTLLPDVTAALDLPHGLPVATGSGDTVAAMIAMGITRPGRAMLGLSTSGQVLRVTDRWAVGPLSPGIHRFAHGLDGLWFEMAAMARGASVMSYWADRLGHPLPDLLAMAEHVAPVGRLTLPAPGLEGYGSFDTEPSDKLGAFRAVIDGLARAFGLAAEAIGRVNSPLATGGGARSDLLLQRIADALKTPVLRPQGAALGASVGAAMLAAVASGAWPRARLDQQPVVDRTFAPRLDGTADPD